MKKLFLFVLGVTALNACKKDSENTPARIDLLTSSNWRVTASTSSTTITGNTSATTVDEYAKLQACDKDGFYKFNTNKTYIYDEGATKCNSSNPQTTTLMWDFNSDQTKLVITPVGSSSSSTSDITELSSSTMRLRQTDSYTSGGSTFNVVYNTTFTSF